METMAKRINLRLAEISEQMHNLARERAVLHEVKTPVLMGLMSPAQAEDKLLSSGILLPAAPAEPQPTSVGGWEY